MTPNTWHQKPKSFSQTVQLLEKYVRVEIIQETKNKQLYYHTIDHALAVKRRANQIFHAIKPVLQQEQSLAELERLNSLINLCAIAHDMVQEFLPTPETPQPRTKKVGKSETATANKLIGYIHKLNQELSQSDVAQSVLVSAQELKIIEDAILATVCDRDPQAGKVSYSFSPYSIYQPYIYSSQPKISIIGSIIALADLGTLGIEGIEPYIHEGILVFLENNLDLQNLILNCHSLRQPELALSDTMDRSRLKTRLLNMTQFMVSLAEERHARLELEIASFTPQARQILKNEIFVHLNQETIQTIKTVVPTNTQTSLEELINFFCWHKNKNLIDQTKLGG